MIHEHMHLGRDVVLRAEIEQLQAEGHDTAALQQRVDEAEAAGTLDEAYESLWNELEAVSASGGDRGPRTLEQIRQDRPGGDVPYATGLKGAALLDRIHGAWLGRCAGCVLGKPVEFWSRPEIERYLRAADSHPLSSYIPLIEPFPDGLALKDTYPETTLGNIDGVPRDDDIDFTVLGLRILETYGDAFTTFDVARAWLENLPFFQVYSAEVIAYRNLVMGLEPPMTALHRNPYRAWMGSHIRVDAYAYAFPGNPARAAELAYRDATLSHVGNGVYGAMWTAACVSAAFALESAEDIILAGLDQIPADCRLAEAVRDIVSFAGTGATWDETWRHLNAQYGHYSPVHSIVNSCATALGLLYGRGDFESTICHTVMAGWDTDSTGATAGSIVGALQGAVALPDKWIAPLKGRLASIVPGASGSAIAELAERTATLARRFST